MDKQTKSNLTNVDHWVRLVYMLIIGLLLAVARMVVWVVAVLQFLIILFTGKGNSNLHNLGQGVSKWCYQALLFLTFSAEQKPFPFDDWPEVDEIVDEENLEGEIIPARSAPENVSIDDVPSFTDTVDDVVEEGKTESSSESTETDADVEKEDKDTK